MLFKDTLKQEKRKAKNLEHSQKMPKIWFSV